MSGAALTSACKSISGKVVMGAMRPSSDNSSARCPGENRLSEGVINSDCPCSSPKSSFNVSEMTQDPLGCLLSQTQAVHACVPDGSHAVVPPGPR